MTQCSRRRGVQQKFGCAKRTLVAVESICKTAKFAVVVSLTSPFQMHANSIANVSAGLRDLDRTLSLPASPYWFTSVVARYVNKVTPVGGISPHGKLISVEPELSGDINDLGPSSLHFLPRLQITSRNPQSLQITRDTPVHTNCPQLSNKL